jgi:hypothetical protein
MRNVTSDRGFARWCVRICVSRLRKREALGLAISAIGRRTLARFDSPPETGKNGGPMSVTFVERADSTGQRWARALTLLLEAGRPA